MFAWRTVEGDPVVHYRIFRAIPHASQTFVLVANRPESLADGCVFQRNPQRSRNSFVAFIDSR